MDVCVCVCVCARALVYGISHTPSALPSYNCPDELLWSWNVPNLMVIDDC